MPRSSPLRPAWYGEPATLVAGLVGSNPVLTAPTRSNSPSPRPPGWRQETAAGSGQSAVGSRGAALTSGHPKPKTPAPGLPPNSRPFPPQFWGEGELEHESACCRNDLAGALPSARLRAAAPMPEPRCQWSPFSIRADGEGKGMRSPIARSVWEASPRRWRPGLRTLPSS